MTATQHTPGPWQHDGTGMIYGQPEDETGGSTFVCDVVQDGAREWMDDTEKANARLIAAAPDILAALLALHDYVECVWADQYPADIAEKVRSAIKQAGESPDWETTALAKAAGGQP